MKRLLYFPLLFGFLIVCFSAHTEQLSVDESLSDEADIFEQVTIADNGQIAAPSDASINTFDTEDSLEQIVAVLPEGEAVQESDAIVEAQPLLYPIDKVEAVIFFDETAKIITASDVRPNLDGRPRTLEDILSMYVLYEKASTKYKIPVSEQTVDKYFTSLQKQHNLTMDQIKEMFAQGGFSYEQGRQELKMMYANNSLLQFLVESRLSVSPEMVQEYYDAHPMIQESNYAIQMATIAIPDGAAREDIKNQIDQYRATGQGLPDISWSDAIVMKKEDFSDAMQPMLNFDLGQIFEQESSTGFDLFRLTIKQEEKVFTLEERRQEIEMRLKEPLFYEMVEKIRAELIEQASIVYPAHAQAVEEFKIASV